MSSEKINPYIVGGEFATLGQFPWQTFLMFDRWGACGGSLIHPEWVLTAAHCIT
jgi:secreted trypsin-like serine protease